MRPPDGQNALKENFFTRKYDRQIDKKRKEHLCAAMLKCSHQNIVTVCESASTKGFFSYAHYVIMLIE